MKGKHPMKNAEGDELQAWGGAGGETGAHGAAAGGSECGAGVRAETGVRLPVGGWLTPERWAKVAPVLLGEVKGRSGLVAAAAAGGVSVAEVRAWLQRAKRGDFDESDEPWIQQLVEVVRTLPERLGERLAKNTSMTLGEHFDGFIAHQIESGRYGSASEVVRAALRLLENSENRVETLRRALEKGEQSGIADYSYEAFLAELDEEARQ